MPFLDLQDTAAGDVVNFVNQLNNNWDQVDSQMKSLITSGTNLPGVGVLNPETGIEAANPNKTDDLDFTARLAVYDGAAWRQQTIETWGAWQNITLTAPFVERSGFTPQLRISNTGMVEFRGGIVNTVSASAWPTGMNIINANQFASTAYAPANTFRKIIAASLPTTTTAFAYAIARIQPNVSNFIELDIQFQGAAGGGNFVMLDGLSYYRDVVS